MDYIKIERTPLLFCLDFVNVNDAPPPATHVVTSKMLDDFLAFINISPPEKQKKLLDDILSKSLDQFFDEMWSEMLPGIPQMIQDSIYKVNTSIYNYQFINLPVKGELSAAVSIIDETVIADVNYEMFKIFQLPQGMTGTRLSLIYSLKGFDFTCEVDVSSWNAINPTEDVTFDADLELELFIPDVPSDKYSLLYYSVFKTKNTDYSSDNLVSKAKNFIGSIFGVSPQLNDLTNNQTIDFLQEISDMLTIVLKSATDYGFNNFAAQVRTFDPFNFNALQFNTPDNPVSPTVELRLTHPFDPAPTLPFFVPSLAVPVMQTSKVKVKAGETLQAIGNFFPPLSSGIIRWEDTTSGIVRKTEIQLGLEGGTPPVSILLPRNGSKDNQNFFIIPHAIPNGRYNYRIRDYDFYIEPSSNILLGNIKNPSVATAWTNWTTITALGGLVNLEMESDNSGVKIMVGTTNLLADGTLSVNLSIPASAVPGTYKLWAILDGQRITYCQIEIVAADQVISSSLQLLWEGIIIRSSPALIMEGSTVTLQGNNFPSNADLRIYWDMDHGTTNFLGEVLVPASGSFQKNLVWPLNVIGNHNIVTVQATSSSFHPHNILPVWVDMIPK